MLSTHMDYTTKKVAELAKQGSRKKASFFRKDSSEASPVVSFIRQIEQSCFVCERIQSTFDRYIATIFYMYKNDPDFRSRFSRTKGFCLSHYGLLFDQAPEHLKGELLEQFLTELTNLYLENMKRVREDLEWFRDKFDYRFADEPWKNAKDALPRSVQKAISVVPEDLP